MEAVLESDGEIRAAFHDLCDQDWPRIIENALYHNYAMSHFKSQLH
jgi:hypothetical protein